MGAVSSRIRSPRPHRFWAGERSPLAARAAACCQSLRSGSRSVWGFCFRLPASSPPRCEKAASSRARPNAGSVGKPRRCARSPSLRAPEDGGEPFSRGLRSWFFSLPTKWVAAESVSLLPALSREAPARTQRCPGSSERPTFAVPPGAASSTSVTGAASGKAASSSFPCPAPTRILSLPPRTSLVGVGGVLGWRFHPAGIENRQERDNALLG